MKLAPGSRLAIEIEPLENGRFKVSQRLRVGISGAKDIGKPMLCTGWSEAWAVVETLAQEQQAQIGLETVRGLRPSREGG